MVRNVIETVFIAWGGNQSLAQCVERELNAQHFNAVVGGGQQTDIFIGTQVLTQIHKATRAILLVENAGGTETDGGYNFSDNLMFEWGYITGTFQPSKVHVFLIDVSAKDLPSDLAGSWASEVSTAGQTREDVARLIAGTFAQDASHSIEMDKLQIMHMWSRVLHYIETYNDAPQCSDIELAHYLVHSIETCYYYMDEDRLEELVGAIRPVSRVLEFAVALVKANIRLFRETGGLHLPLPFDSYMELKTFFERPFDISYQDEGLDHWFRFFCMRRSALLRRMVAINPEFTEADRRGLMEETLQLTNQALGILSQIVERHPADAGYANMYRGYIHRDKYLLLTTLGDHDAAVAENRLAVRAKESMYIEYKTRYPQDLILIQHLGQEYYLALAERVDFVEDPIERMMMKKTIGTFLEKLERSTDRQHVLLSELRTRVGVTPVS